MVRELESRKDLVDDSNLIPTPCGRGSSCASEASYKCRGGVFGLNNPNTIPPTLTLPLGWGGNRDSNNGNSQSLINDKHLFTYSLIHLFTRKRYAFTLAEVLITLGVIGIVAAMTIPTLVQNYREKATVAKLTKAYSMLSNAYQLAKTDYGSIETWFSGASKYSYDEDGNMVYNQASFDNSKKFYDIMQKYLKVTSVCLQDNLDCDRYNTSNPRYYLNGQPLVESGKTDTLNLQDGTSLVGFWWHGTIANFSVDLNGIHGKPNIIGKDIFFFAIDRKNGVVPFGKIPTSNKFSNDCLGSKPKGYGCTAWVIENKNMDYLKCDDLSWDGKHKCSD